MGHWVRLFAALAIVFSGTAAFAQRGVRIPQMPTVADFRLIVASPELDAFLEANPEATLVTMDACCISSHDGARHYTLTFTLLRDGLLSSRQLHCPVRASVSEGRVPAVVINPLVESSCEWR
jgi:hypothetical protein